MNDTGDYRVQLVEPTTKQVYKEHVKDGKCYVEAEPDGEYLIRIEAKRIKDYRVLMHFEVDETFLGYQKVLKTDAVCTGFWTRNQGVYTHKAFQFAIPPIRTDGGAVLSGNKVLGSVSVKFYKAVEAGLQIPGDYKPSLVTRKIDTSCATVKTKMLRSKPGSLIETIAKSVLSDLESESETSRDLKKTMAYKAGEHLETVTLYYGTALGLIHAGVLPKPPFWERARLEVPFASHVDPSLANIVPTIIHQDAVVADGALLQGARDIELFDLTHL